MGYRQYFYEIDNCLVEEIKRCVTEEDLYNVCKKHNIDCSKEVNNDGTVDYYCPPYKFGKEIYEFGKYYENSNNIYSNGVQVFESEELQSRYSDYGIIICNKNAVKSAIEWQREALIKLYQNLIDNKTENPFLENSHLDKMMDHCSAYLYWWKNYPYNLEENNENLTDSWLYEHTIFDLVRIYKTFDFSKKSIMFFGY